MKRERNLSRIALLERVGLSHYLLCCDHQVQSFISLEDRAPELIDTQSQPSLIVVEVISHDSGKQGEGTTEREGIAKAAQSFSWYSVEAQSSSYRKSSFNDTWNISDRLSRFRLELRFGSACCVVNHTSSYVRDRWLAGFRLG